MTERATTAMSARQRETLAYLRAHPWSSQEHLTEALDSTARGMSNILNRLLDQGRVTCRAKPDDPYAYLWAPKNTST